MSICISSISQWMNDYIDYMYIHSSWWLYTYGLSQWMDYTPALPTFDPRPPRPPPRCGRLVLARAGPRLPRQVGRGPESWGISGGTAGWSERELVEPEKTWRVSVSEKPTVKVVKFMLGEVFFLFKVNSVMKRELNRTNVLTCETLTSMVWQ